MKITRELLNARLAEAVERREELAAKLNAQIGAINQLHLLLGLLDLPEPAPAADKPAPPPIPRAQ